MSSEKRTQKSHARAPGQTHITISMPMALAIHVKGIADFEGRPLSSMVRILIKEALDARGRESSLSLTVAEVSAKQKEIERLVEQALSRVAEGKEAVEKR